MYLFHNWLIKVKKVITEKELENISWEHFLELRNKYLDEYYESYRGNFKPTHSYKEAMKIIESDARFKVPLDKAFYHIEYPCGTHEIEVSFESGTHDYEFDTTGESYEECIRKLAHVLVSNP